MRLKISLIIFNIALVSCGHMPDKPSVELGVIDYPRSEVIINITGSEITSTKQLTYRAVIAAINTSTVSERIPLSVYDRAVCFRPREWEKVAVYMHLLEDYASHGCN